MAEILFILFVTWVVIWVDTAITRHNYGSLWNGIGVLPDVLSGKAQAPMQYRVLVPWICQFFSRWFDKSGQYPYLSIYVRVKWISVLLAIATAFWYFSLLGASPFIATAMLGLFFCIGCQFDYGETYWDVAFFAFAFGVMLSQPWWMIPALFAVTFVAALNKETAAFIPFTAFLAGEWTLMLFLGAAFGAGYTIPFVRYGYAKRYCNWFEFKGNWFRIKETWKQGVGIVLNGYVMFLALLIGSVYLLGSHIVSITPIELSMLCLFFFTIPITIWHELRMWNPVALGLIPLVLK